MKKVDILRLLLPPVHQAEQAHLALYYHEKRWHPAQQYDWNSLAQDYAPKQLQLGLHPKNVAITQLNLPPLPAAKLSAAVREQVALLSLQDTHTLSIAHSPLLNGKVTVCWTQLSTLQHWSSFFAQYRFKALRFYPACAFLPDDMTQTPMCHIDHWLVLRPEEQHGVILPPHANTDRTEVCNHIEAHYPQFTPFQWLPDRDYHSWNGKPWAWRLANRHSSSSNPAYYPALLLWGSILSAISLTGLHLYSQQLSQAGQSVKRQMTQAVQTAYPQLSVVLNPLQQVRQLQAAANSTPDSPSASYTQLIQSAAPLLDQAQAQIQSVHYRDGLLTLRLRPAAGLKASSVQALQQQAQQHGLQLNYANAELSIRLADAASPNKATP